VLIDVNPGDYIFANVAVLGAYELRPLITRQAATEARDYLLGLIAGRRLIVQTLQDPDNFGRYLILVWLPDGTSVNRAMIDSGHAAPYVH
jgi:endonuclease YncB( thermonuclease family)